MYYSPEGLISLFIQFCLLVAFIYPGYLILNLYFKRKGEDTSLPENHGKIVFGGFFLSALFIVVAKVLYNWFDNG
jgi:hypothetical protein